MVSSLTGLGCRLGLLILLLLLLLLLPIRQQQPGNLQLTGTSAVQVCPCGQQQQHQAQQLLQRPPASLTHQRSGPLASLHVQGLLLLLLAGGLPGCY
jgi:hypothetical protein